MALKQSLAMHERNIEHDSIDEYFECITACASDDDGMTCLTQCIEVHLKKEASQ